jgi:hypothetical protein
MNQVDHEPPLARKKSTTAELAKRSLAPTEFASQALIVIEQL